VASSSEYVDVRSDDQTRHGGSLPEDVARAAALTLTLVVPLFNEARRFRVYAQRLADFVATYGDRSELIFVDDGSSDGTPELVDAFAQSDCGANVRLVRLPHCGKGAAVAAGLSAAESDVAAFCDVDLATPLGELARIIDAATRAPILAIGSRGTAASRITRRQEPIREYLGRMYNRVVQLLVVPGVVDTQCGAKAASTQVWQKILPFCREVGFAWDVEVISTARTLAIPVQEIGVEWRHRDGSQVRVMRDGLQMVRAIPRIRRNAAATLRYRSQHSDVVKGTFDDANAELLAAADPNHWWLRSKATFVSLAMRRFAPRTGWLVDIGSGPGDVTSMLGWAPDRTLAVEGNHQLVHEAKRRHSIVPVGSDAEHIPLADGTASVVCLLDVIEHLGDPVPTLREAARLLSPDGRLVVNVPAHPRLWSSADEFLGHARRYTRSTLVRDLEAAGLRMVWASHVFSWLVAPVWLRRRVIPSSEPQLGLDTASQLIDRAAMLLSRLEWSIASRRPLSVGTSLLCVAAPAEAPSPIPPRTEERMRRERDLLFSLQQTLYQSKNPTRRWLHRSRRGWIIRTLRRTGSGAHRALEVGPGSGVYLPTLAGLATEVVAIDIEEEYLRGLESMRRRFANVELVRDDITRSALPAESFDIILCSEVVEHIPDSQAALAEMHRLLRRGGVLVLSTPQRYSPLEVASKIAFRPRIIDVVRRVYGEPILETGHVNLMTREALNQQLDRAGFTVEERHTGGVYVPLLAELFGRHALRLERALEPRLRRSRLDWLLWTQYVVAGRRT
jgi:2-polyprenyl-3-methyl-5-hydroxy-6-metoxy-1,4-benzoquinol methylase/glycosyltransferase involved in cell wall biosynthesis